MSEPVRMTKAELAEAIESMWDHLASGRSDLESMDLMGLDADTYNKIRGLLVDKKTDELRKRPIEHVYVEYIIQQTNNIGQLTDLIKKAKTDKQWSAAIAAIRTRADLYDRLIVKGQECGIFKKEPEKKELIVGHMIADMTTQEIKIALAQAVSSLTKMMRSFGDHSIMDTTADPGEIHYGDALSDEDHAATSAIIVAPKTKHDVPTSKRGKSKRSKTSKHIRGKKSFKIMGE